MDAETAAAALDHEGNQDGYRGPVVARRAYGIGGFVPVARERDQVTYVLSGGEVRVRMGADGRLTVQAASLTNMIDLRPEGHDAVSIGIRKD